MSYGLKLKCAETEKSIEGYTDHGVMDPSSPASRIMVKLLLTVKHMYPVGVL